MDIIKKTKSSQIKNEGGILSSEIKGSCTIESSKFYSSAPFPNYQGYENAHDLQKTLSENVFLNDLKKHIGLGKKFIEVGSGTCQLSLAFAIGTNNLLVAMDSTKESLKLGKDFAEKNNINNVTFLNSDIFDINVPQKLKEIYGHINMGIYLKPLNNGTININDEIVVR